MSSESNLCMITAVKREKRKLIYLPSRNAQDYFSYCEEIGCEWEGLLNSIPVKLEPAALIELPDFLVEDSYSGRNCLNCKIRRAYLLSKVGTPFIILLPRAILMEFLFHAFL